MKVLIHVKLQYFDSSAYFRQLAIQIAEQFEALGSGIGVKCAVLVGVVDHVQQSIALGKRPHIVVATPGRLVDHLSNTKGFTLRTLKYLVMFCDYVKKNMVFILSCLDEADRLLNEDFEKTIDQVLNVIPRNRKTYLFSANMTKKDCYLIYILTEMSGSTSMVFTRTCDSTRLLALILRNLGFRAIPISGQMTQKIKETGGKKRRKDGDDDEEEVHKYLDRKNGKSFKKSQKR
ncbi:hypothetical protein RJ640_002808 [Escallonia rubra]|uniref:Helicase ATP-binding domain-containing protein n=1 Tax=Escallonia rubra TaxID=112253 RepID=A0AA88RZZ8_9ASTE|nr:hypothetical protein RJ640_002808 [Escallonia rubra]